MTHEFHPLVKQMLDGERTANDLPPELLAEAAEALRLMAAVDRRDVKLSPVLESRVMAAVRSRAAAPGWRAWRWLVAPSVPPWAVGALVAAGLLIYFLIPGGGDNGSGAAVPAATAIAPPESVYVKFVLYAPTAHQVALAGTFNRWEPAATPLARVEGEGVWTVTIALPVGQHQYAFVVDGRRWVVDPAAPAVDDGFGRRNSIMSVNASSRQAL
ncbi:MAG TPA: isoamylase early set domain-containing protein [Gemmatimonadales bacterium]|nr:isoamylase early set domain-containing protein [Gemmatimonadales bacterium]